MMNIDINGIINSLFGRMMYRKVRGELNKIDFLPFQAEAAKTSPGKEYCPEKCPILFTLSVILRKI